MAGAKPKRSSTWEPTSELRDVTSKICGASSQTFRHVQLCRELRTQGISKTVTNQLQDFHVSKKCLFAILYVPVTVHREQSVKKEYQQDATI